MAREEYVALLLRAVLLEFVAATLIAGAFALHPPVTRYQVMSFIPKGTSSVN
jgi:hypothetical protein